MNLFERMAVICNTCGLPEDLCACGELAKDTNLDIAEMLVVGPLVAMVFYTKTEVNSSSVDSIVKMSLRGLMG